MCGISRGDPAADVQLYHYGRCCKIFRKIFNDGKYEIIGDMMSLTIAESEESDGATYRCKIFNQIHEIYQISKTNNFIPYVCMHSTRWKLRSTCSAKTSLFNVHLPKSLQLLENVVTRPHIKRCLWIVLGTFISPMWSQKILKSGFYFAIMCFYNTSLAAVDH